MNKRGQFFLLAAVIISVVVLGLGANVNQAVSSEEPDDFYDIGYDVKREVGEVMDYAVYSGFDGSVDLDEFVDLLAEDIKEQSPESSFLFVYGDESEIKLLSYGASSSGSQVCFGGFCQTISSDLNDYISGSEYDLDSSGDIRVELAGNEYIFPVSEVRQVLFIIQKNVGEESYVSAG